MERAGKFTPAATVEVANTASRSPSIIRVSSTSFFSAAAALKFSERYRFDTFYQYDFERQKVTEQVFMVTRFFNRFALELAIEVDEGEDNDVTFHVNFSPRELLSTFRREHP